MFLSILAYSLTLCVICCATMAQISCVGVCVLGGGGGGGAGRGRVHSTG